MNIEQTLQLLDIQEVTTSKQKKNGTREFKLPVRDQYGAAIHVASYKAGYVRRTKAGGYCPSWQLNKRCKSEPQYYKIEKNGETLYRKYTTRTCKLIPNEQDRLEYLISFCLKNYYIKQSNMLSSGEFIPKWKHNDIQEELQVYKDEYRNRVNEVNNPEVKVIVNGHRYNVI